jgi:hypothetical protein
MRNSASDVALYGLVVRRAVALAKASYAVPEREVSPQDLPIPHVAAGDRAPKSEPTLIGELVCGEASGQRRDRCSDVGRQEGGAIRNPEDVEVSGRLLSLGHLQHEGPCVLLLLSRRKPLIAEHPWTRLRPEEDNPMPVLLLVAR